MPKRGGWWVKATVNSVPSALGRTPRDDFSNSAQISFQNKQAAPERRRTPKPRRHSRFQRKKSRQAIPSIITRGSPRSNQSFQTRGCPTGTFLDRVHSKTPAFRLETSTLAAKLFPQSGRGPLHMESHPAILRNRGTFSKKILLDKIVFSKTLDSPFDLSRVVTKRREISAHQLSDPGRRRSGPPKGRSRGSSALECQR